MLDLVSHERKIFPGGTCFTPGVVLYYNQKLILASPFFRFCRFDSFMAERLKDFM